MAHFTLIRPGGWVGLTLDGGTTDPALSTLHTELEALDADQYAALAEAGGTWNPAAEIEIGGAGLHVAGPCDWSNGLGSVLTGNGLVNVGATVSIHSGATLLMDPAALATFTDSAWTWNDTSTLAMTSTSTLSLAAGSQWVNAAASTSFGATAALNYHTGATIDYGGCTASGIMNLSGRLVLEGAGGSIGWRYTTVADASLSVNGGAWDIVFVPNHLAAPRVYTLSAPSSLKQCRTIFSRMGAPSGSAFTVNNIAAVAVTPPLIGNAWAECMYDAGAADWFCLGYGFGG